MADNTVLNTGTGGDTVRDKDRAGVKTQIMALDLNPAGAETLMAGAIPILGYQAPATTGTIGSATATVQATVTNYTNVTITVSGTHAGMNLTFEASDDSGTTWFAYPFVREVDGQILANTGVLVSNSATMYSASLPGLTTVRVRATAWTSGGTNSVRISPGSMPLEPVVSIGARRQVATYSATYRLAAATAGPTHLAFTYVANTDKQLATLHHLSTSTKTVRIKKIMVSPSIFNAGVYQFETRKLSATTAPATGNPAITPASMDGGDPAAEAVCLALPTTAGSLAAADQVLSSSIAINAGAGAGVTNPLGVDGEQIILYDTRGGMGAGKDITLRAGVAEGIAVMGRCTTAVAGTFTVHIEFTEE